MTPLEQRIREAFGCTAAVDSVSTEEARSLNHGINRLDSVAVMRLLPLLMLKELYAKTEFSFQGTGDHLVYFLDGLLLKDKADAEKSGNDRSYRVQCEIKERRFSSFSKAQAAAIIAWLKEVAISKYGELCPGDIASAMQFWTQRHSGQTVK